MAIKPAEGGGWRVDIQPGGRGAKRYRKTFKFKADAVQWEKRMQARPEPNAGQSAAIATDTRRLLDLVNLWYDLHGVNLKAKNTYSRLKLLAEALGNPIATAFTAADFAAYRARRIADGLKPATLNRERSYLAAVFSELSRLKHLTYPNPMHSVRPVRVDQIELSFLDDAQILQLFDSLRQSDNQDVYLVSKIALATGARWSEVEGLRTQDVSLKPAMVAFHGTKSGKSRYVPIVESLAGEIHQRLQQGRFKSCYSAFRLALLRSGIELPDGQLVHVLRHTFASHFVQKGGDLVTLQRILGHSSLTVTMRYAHLAPSFLDQARNLSPLSVLTVG